MSCITSLVAQREASKNEDRVPVQKKGGEGEKEAREKEEKEKEEEEKKEERTGCHFSGGAAYNGMRSFDRRTECSLNETFRLLEITWDYYHGTLSRRNNSVRR